MKKVFAGLCAGVFALALIGCGDEGGKTPPKPEDVKTEDVKKAAGDAKETTEDIKKDK